MSAISKQVRRSIVTKTGFLLAVLLINGSLAACGKKAGHIDPPPDVTEDTFPRTYPDPSTDPKPEPAPAANQFWPK